MYIEPWRGLYKQGIETTGINQTNKMVPSKAYKEQLGALKRIIMLDSSIALDSCIGQESVDPRGSSRVVRERQSLVLF